MTWPLIPPEYEGWSFLGSPFPGYDDPEFADFREYGSVERRKTNDADRCPVHGRFLSYHEHAAGACFWCRPDLDRRWAQRTQGRHAQQPSESDDAEVIQEAF